MQNRGIINIIPLGVHPPLALNTVYPNLTRDVLALKNLLSKRPKFAAGTPREIPTIINQDAGQIFLSKVRYLDFSWGTGIGFLVQYSQDLTPYAVGARLDYQIEALNKEGTLGVSASFDVHHPALPKTEENEVLRDNQRKEYTDYVARMERLLNQKADSSFVPSLLSVQQLVGTLRFDAKTDPAGWNTSFDGKKIKIERRNHAIPEHASRKRSK